MRPILPARLMAFLGLWLVSGWVYASATVSPTLEASIFTNETDANLGTVIVAFHGEGPLGTAELAVLQQAGIFSGLTLNELNMAAVNATVGQVPDIAGHADEALIRNLLLNRRIDVLDDGNFQPETELSRADLAFTLALNTPLRQRVDEVARFFDVDDTLRPFAEAVASNGPTLRDFDFANPPLIEVGEDQFKAVPGPRFEPQTANTRVSLTGGLAGPLFRRVCCRPVNRHKVPAPSWGRRFS